MNGGHDKVYGEGIAEMPAMKGKNMALDGQPFKKHTKQGPADNISSEP
jgi:hypothetical protein